MIHHIRFLKLPRVERTNPSYLTVKALITITTDLGDSFFPSSISLSAGLWSGDRLLADSAHFLWRNGMRSLWVELQFTTSPQIRWPLHMQISHARGGRGLNLLSLEHLPQIIDVCSHPIHPQIEHEGSKRVSRVFHLASGHLLRIHEDTGDSIARHIWYVGLSVPSLHLLSQGRRYCPDRLSVLPIRADAACPVPVVLSAASPHSIQSA